jgi:hypothetical protein
MNVATYLMLTVPLVGGSLFVYDQVRSDKRPQPTDSATDLVAPPPRAEQRPEEGPTLTADPTVQIERMVRETVEKMLRERVGAAPAASSGTTTEVTGAGSIPLPEVPAIDLPAGSTDAPAGTYDERTVKVLRSYMDEIQRREREERAVQMVEGQLDRLGVQLNDAQRKGVIDATIAHQKQVRDALRAIPPGQQNRDARNKAVTEVREQYTRTIQNLVPSAEAEKIINQMGQGWRGPGGAMGGNGFGPGGERGSRDGN